MSAASYLVIHLSCEHCLQQTCHNTKPISHILAGAKLLQLCQQVIYIMLRVLNLIGLKLLLIHARLLPVHTKPVSPCIICIAADVNKQCA